MKFEANKEFMENLSLHKEVPEQKPSQIYDIASIFTHFCSHVRQL